jgi:hypothetical protein
MREIVLQGIENKILNKIYGSGRGAVLSTDEFLAFGSRASIDKALSRLAQKGKLKRLARGLYYYPKTHSVMGGLSPNPEAVAKALAGKHGIRLQPTGAYAANLLGLSTQVPAKIVFLTDGPGKTVKIDNMEICLKKTTPRNMGTAGKTSGLVIQALRHLGKEHVNEDVIKTLSRKLSIADKRQLLKDLQFAPVWVGVHLRKIALGDDF